MENDIGLIIFIAIMLGLLIFVWWIAGKEPSHGTTTVDIWAGTPTPKPIDNRTTTDLNVEKTGHEWGSGTDPTKL
jgi:hypothetical protein